MKQNQMSGGLVPGATIGGGGTPLIDSFLMTMGDYDWMLKVVIGAIIGAIIGFLINELMKFLKRRLFKKNK